MRRRSWHQKLLGLFVGIVGMVAMLVVAPAPAYAATASWQQDGYNATDSGYNPLETAITPATVGNLDYRWSLTSPVVRDACSKQSRPVVAGGRMFAGNQAGIGAYDAATGKRLWFTKYGRPSDSATPILAVVSGRLYVASSECTSESDPSTAIFALDAATGHQLWLTGHDGHVSMVVDKGVVAVSGFGLGGAVTTGFQATDGAKLWSRSGELLAGSVSADGRLLLRRDDDSGAVGTRAVSILTGAPLWTNTKDWYALAASPAGNRVFVRTGTGGLAAVDPGNGAVLWSVATGGYAAAVDQNRIYVARDSGGVAARNVTTGAQVWGSAQSTLGQVNKPIVAGGVLYLTSVSGTVLTMRAGTGDFIDSFLIHDVVGHPVVVNGRLYVTDGRVLDMFSL